MLNISGVYPPLFSGGADVFFFGFIRSLIMRSCFNIDIKRTLNIAGFYRSVTNPECWTVKLLDSKGVYGLMITGVQEDEKTAECILDIKYFPDFDENLLDDFSVMEILTAESPEYKEGIREFVSVPSLCGMFSVGSLVIGLDKKFCTASLSLVSETVSETLIKDGLYVREKGIELVPPMGADRKIKALRLALPFFRCFCGCFAYSIQQTASAFHKTHAPGYAVIISADGTSVKYPSHKNRTAEYTFAFGTEKTALPAGFDCVTVPGWWEKKQTADRAKILDSRPRLIIVSGFLGSGKTTYIRSLIEYETDKNRFVGVIQNEAGQSGLDGFLVDYDYSLVEIDEGCMCCSLSGQLKKAISKLTEKRMPDTIILETSGLANPMNLIDEIDDVRELVRFDSVTVLLDMQTAEKLLNESELAGKQIMSADIVVITKSAFYDREDVFSLAAKVEKLNPDAMIIAPEDENINFSLLYGTENESGLMSHRAEAGHCHSHEDIGAKKICFDSPVTKEELLRFIESMPSGVFRVKGIVDVEGEGTIIVQSVGGRTELFQPDRQPPEERFLVVIGKNVK